MGVEKAGEISQCKSFKSEAIKGPDSLQKKTDWIKETKRTLISCILLVLDSKPQTQMSSAKYCAAYNIIGFLIL